MMKSRLFLIGAILTLTAMNQPAAAQPVTQAVTPSPIQIAPPEKTILFFGDSITEAAIQPDGYIAQLKQALDSAGRNNPKSRYRLIGAGVSGNKVPDLQRRLARDVLAKKPDVVFIYIGINDVWHFTHPCCKDNGGGTSKEKFESGLTELVQKIKATGASVVVCTPTVIGEKPDGANPQDAMLGEYATLSRRVARNLNTTLCDLRLAFTTHLQTHNPSSSESGILTTDGVHLNRDGNRLVAAEMLKHF